MALQHLRSNTASKRPTAGAMSDGQIAVNTNATSPGLFFKDAGGSIIKVGPVHVGTTAPNSSPAAGGSTGNSLGEQWLDTSGGGYVLKIWDGSAWRSEVGEFVDAAGDTMTGALILPSGTAAAPALGVGSTDNGIYSPGADQVAISTNGTGRLFVGSSGDVTAKDVGFYIEKTGLGNLQFTFDGSTSSIISNSSSAPLVLGTNSAERLRITSAGQLSFIGAGSSGSPAVGFNGSAPSNSLVIDSTGKVGLGTSSPGSVLTAKGPNTSTSNWGNLGITSEFSINAANRIYTGLLLQDSGTSGAAGVGYEYDGTGYKLHLATAATISSGLSTRLTIDRSGNVGIGTTSPGGTLDVKAASSTAPLIVQGPSSEFARIDDSGRLLVGTSSARTNFINTSGISAAFQVEGTGFNESAASIIRNSASANAPYFILGKTRSGSVGGTTVVQNDDPLGVLSFQGIDGSEFVEGANIKAEVDGTPGANDMPGRLVFSTTADGASSPTERMRIDSAGRLDLFGATNCIVSNSLAAAGTTYTIYAGRNSGVAGNPAGGTDCFYVYTNGNVVNTNNSYGAISDIKLKDNIIDAGSQWADIRALRVRKYNFKEGQTHTQIGLIAQEVELVSPGLVSESPDRDQEGNDLGTVTKSVNYSVLYMKAVKALQEAMERIETLEAEVAALKAQ